MNSQENRPGNTQPDWVGAWYTAPMRMQPAHLTSRMLSQIVHLHAGGQQVRLRLSNRYGESPLVLSEVSVGRALFGLLQAGPTQAVLFAGLESVTIEAGVSVVSDPVAFPVEAFSDLAIGFRVAQGDVSTGHFIALQTSYVSTPGAQGISAIPEIENLLLSYPLMTSSWWALTGVDVLPEQPMNVVVAFGDSTTDGAFSTIGANRRYPDCLAHRFAAASEVRFASVLNAGIGWSELLAAHSPLGGEAGLRRFTWDALEQPGVTDLIVQMGLNDLRHDAPAETIIDGLQQLAAWAREKRLRVFGTTILPAVYTPTQVVQRQKVNTWMREEWSSWFNGMFDFAAALEHPEGGGKLNPLYDSGDGTHPNDLGYQSIAEAVDLEYIASKHAH